MNYQLAQSEFAPPAYKQKGIFFMLTLLLYFLTSVAIYNLYNTEQTSKIQRELNAAYRVILDNSILKLEYITQQIPQNKEKNTRIILDNTDIRSCVAGKCYKINLFDFVSEVNKHIPSYIDYKIVLNRQFLDSNNKLDNYELEKTYNINQYNQIMIGLSLDKNYTSTIKKNISIPFLIAWVSLTIFMVLSVLHVVLTYYRIKNFYYKYFKDEYNNLHKNLELRMQSNIEDIESKLLKRIWDLEYANSKDLDLNKLFSEEASKLASIVQGQESDNFDIAPGKDSLCTLGLYMKGQVRQKISIPPLVETFTERFAKFSENINFEIKSDVKNIQFASKAALYQIIYSIIFYLFFMLQKQSPSYKHNIRLDISENSEEEKIIFQFDGRKILSEDELTKLSPQFFRKNINPFLLGIAQIFSVLRGEGYFCKVYFEKSNVISIEKQRIAKKDPTDNIVKLRP